jgi:uncharacterized membrane protein
MLHMYRWLILAIVTIIIISIRTYRYGFFHGKDWLLYLILCMSIGFTIYHKKQINQQQDK